MPNCDVTLHTSNHTLCDEAASTSDFVVLCASIKLGGWVPGQDVAAAKITTAKHSIAWRSMAQRKCQNVVPLLAPQRDGGKAFSLCHSTVR